MLLVAPVRESKRIAESKDGLWGLELLKQKRSVVPAITHVDYSARLQTVDAQRNPEYYALLKRFQQDTGCPLVINTSFNVRGEPIVRTPREAYTCFMRSGIDWLVVGGESTTAARPMHPGWARELRDRLAHALSPHRRLARRE